MKSQNCCAESHRIHKVILLVVHGGMKTVNATGNISKYPASAESCRQINFPYGKKKPSYNKLISGVYDTSV